MTTFNYEVFSHVFGEPLKYMGLASIGISDKSIGKGVIHAVNKDELRKKAIAKLSLLQNQSIIVSESKYPRYSNNRIVISNNYYGTKGVFIVTTISTKKDTLNVVSRLVDRSTGKLEGRIDNTPQSRTAQRNIL